MTIKEQDLDFEKNLTKLDQIVRNLQDQKIGLNQRLSEFEEGVKLYKECKTYLDSAEKKIKVLLEDLKQTDYEDDTP